MKRLELLAPAGNAEIAIEAIKHGADAVYIGAPSHGARQAASNSLDDIKRTIDYAHIFNARVYVTVNTIVYESELRDVERMIWELYRIGTDALIVQDMGILRLDIPPIALHASTQCDIRTPEKALFLQEVGFSQLVLARELTIAEIRKIADTVKIPLEVFVHGALCVSYSGRCAAGYACNGRSGNRGECPQICRQPFTLKDADGKILAKDKYLLSLKDLRADHQLEALIEAGASSFKIEGRLKEAGYVKNVVGAYSRKLNEIIAKSEGKYERSSAGTSTLTFTPAPERSFNRGFTDYRMSGRSDPKGIASIRTPKSLGEKITDVKELKPGDGISFFDPEGNYTGVMVNGIRNGKIIGNKPFILPKGAEIRRTSSVEWKKLMDGETAVRKLWVDISIDETGLTAREETGAMVRLPLGMEGEEAAKPTDYKRIFEKLGNTPFTLREFENGTEHLFFRASALTELRRKLIDELLTAKRIRYKFDYRRSENRETAYPETDVDFGANIANSKAAEFYRTHGVKEYEEALELQNRRNAKGRTIMTSRHCVLRELGLCLKNNPKIKMPLTLESGKLRFSPVFNCKDCEMRIVMT